MKSLFDMKTVCKLQYALLLLCMMLTVSCSTDEVSDEMNPSYNIVEEKNAELDEKLMFSDIAGYEKLLLAAKKSKMKASAVNLLVFL